MSEIPWFSHNCPQLFWWNIAITRRNNLIPFSQNDWRKVDIR
jgi:hypothetical protein